jgi:signal transduction histidine kinase
MIFIWFIYGLAFFTLGLVIIIYPRKGSMFRLANHIWLIAGFGILHGINEWLDMFIVLEEPFPPGILKLIRIATVSCSFLFLLRFGAQVITDGRRKFRTLQAVPVILFTIWAAIFATSSSRLLMGDIWARYLLCAPGAVLTAIGLFLQIPQFKETKLRGAIRNLRLAAITFAVYAVFAGLIVKKADFFPASFLNYDLFRSTFGVPVQVFRALCAIVLAWSTARLLIIFRWETQEELDKYRREMEKNARLVEIGTMGSMMAQQLDEPLAVTRLLLQRLAGDLAGVCGPGVVTDTLKKSLSEVSRAAETVERFRSVTQTSDITVVAPVDIYQIAKRVIAVFGERARRANLTISLKDMAFVPFMSMTIHELEQMFFIMIQNAIDAAQVSQRQRLTISSRRGKEQIELWFADTCGGIAPESLEHIFDPHFTSEPGAKEVGFRLAIAKQLVGAHGGKISVENRPGVDTTFHVTIPTQ